MTQFAAFEEELSLLPLNRGTKWEQLFRMSRLPEGKVPFIFSTDPGTQLGTYYYYYYT